MMPRRHANHPSTYLHWQLPAVLSLLLLPAAAASSASEQRRRGLRPGTPARGGGFLLVDQLASLAELRRAGDLSHDEFALAKQQLLQGPSPPPHGADRYDVVTEFGAVGDGVADDTKPLQAGIDAASRAGTVCFIPRGTYRITAPLLINLGYGIEGSLRIESDWATIRASAPHGGSQTLPAPAAMESMVNVTTASHLTMARLLLDANDGTATYGLRAFKISGAQARIEQVSVRGARSHGFLLEACQVSYWHHLTSLSNGGEKNGRAQLTIIARPADNNSHLRPCPSGDGFYLRGANGASLTHLVAQSNGGNGIRMEGLTWINAAGHPEMYSGGAYLVRSSLRMHVLTRCWPRAHCCHADCNALPALAAATEGILFGEQRTGRRQHWQRQCACWTDDGRLDSRWLAGEQPRRWLQHLIAERTDLRSANRRLHARWARRAAARDGGGLSGAWDSKRRQRQLQRPFQHHPCRGSEQK
jgi:hypothetical protein